MQVYLQSALGIFIDLCNKTHIEKHPQILCYTVFLNYATCSPFSGIHALCCEVMKKLTKSNKLSENNKHCIEKGQIRAGVLPAR